MQKQIKMDGTFVNLTIPRNSKSLIKVKAKKNKFHSWKLYFILFCTISNRNTLGMILSETQRGETVLIGDCDN